MRTVFSLLLAAALLVCTVLSAQPAPHYIRFMNATDCVPALKWENSKIHYAYSDNFNNQTSRYADFQSQWATLHPSGAVGGVRLINHIPVVSYITTVPLKFAFNANTITLPVRHGQLGVCNHHPVVFDFYVSGDALVFRVVAIPSIKGVNAK